MTQDNGKVQFNLAADTTKQLLTLSSAILSLTVVAFAYLDPVRVRAAAPYAALAWALFAVSVVLGIVTLGALVAAVDQGSVWDGPVKWPAVLQWLFFIAGIALMALFGALVLY